MSSILYVPIFTGELGWELINYVPYINNLCFKTSYDEVHITVRPGRESIYPMGTHFDTVNLTTATSMGNSGPKAPKSSVCSRLEKQFGKVDMVATPPRGIRYLKPRKFLKYQPSQDALHKWKHIPENAITLLIRGRKFGRHKNWGAKNWNELCRHLVELGYTPVLTGTKHIIDVDVPDGCVDFQDNTTLEDLLAIMSKSVFVIGQSTGPAHFASLAGVPHAIWGTQRLVERYLNSWNPHKTMVEYHSCKDFQITVDNAKKLAETMIRRLS